MKRMIMLVFLILLVVLIGSAQFRDDFYGDSISLDPNGVHGWAFRTGDGSAEMNFQARTGYASINVDATKDKNGIWWAMIRRQVSGSLDLNKMSQLNHEFRIEARIRVSHAPRRVNLHLNTQRTTDFHSHLMEFDIPDTSNWHTISMTTRDFDAVPGDNVYGQLALMDWGLEKYRVDVDYFKVDIVNTNSAGPDQGVQVPYHPDIPDPIKYSDHITAVQDGMIDLEYTDMNFNDWSAQDESGRINLLTVDGTRYVILRWDLTKYEGKKVIGSGLLELVTYSLQRSPEYNKDFGMVRVTEIIGGDSQWDQAKLTYNSLCRGQSMNSVLNPQMVIDVNVAERTGNKTLITISNPVLQRMVDGKTLGLAIKPLGAVSASFYALENKREKLSPKLHLDFSSE